MYGCFSRVGNLT